MREFLFDDETGVEADNSDLLSMITPAIPLTISITRMKNKKGEQTHEHTEYRSGNRV